jgi:diguanylate cyclase (GGDEF)-like protein
MFSSASARAEHHNATAFNSTFELQNVIKRADAHSQQAQYQQALELLTQAYQASENLADNTLRNDVINAMANVYYNTGQLDQAYRYYTELLELDKARGDKAALSITYFNLGHVNASRKQFSKASRNFKASLKLSRELADDMGIASTLKAMGVNAQAQSKLITALKHLRESLKIFVAIHDNTQSARVQRHLGDIAHQQQRYPHAIDHYLAALSVLQKNPFSKALMRTHRGLSESYETMGDLAQAIEHHHRYADLLKQLLEQQNKEVTQRLQVQFETQRFAAENEQLALLNQHQELELEHRQDTLKMQYLLILLALGIIVLVVILWRRSKRHAHTMQLLATKDELTGLKNRRAIMELAMKEWHRSIRFDRDYCCFAIDIDHFKNINDTWGHGTGDAVLKLISSTLESTLRVTDNIGRIGGEEFLLISIETNIDKAAALAERIRSKVENLKHPHQTDAPVTISIGLAQLEHQTSLDELIAQADEALYQSKNNGRNRVTIYQSAEP